MMFVMVLQPCGRPHRPVGAVAVLCVVHVMLMIMQRLTIWMACVLLVLLLIAWGLSYHHTSICVHWAGHQGYCAISQNGAVAFRLLRVTNPSGNSGDNIIRSMVFSGQALLIRTQSDGWTHLFIHDANPPPFFGFRFHVNRYRPLTSYDLHIPYWSMMVLVSLLLVPSIAARWRRKRRLASGCCLHCGYNLRAHHPGQKCPECGTEVPPALTRERGE